MGYCATRVSKFCQVDNSPKRFKKSDAFVHNRTPSKIRIFKLQFALLHLYSLDGKSHVIGSLHHLDEGGDNLMKLEYRQ